MTIEEEIALRLIKQRLPLRIERNKLRVEITELRKRLYNLSKMIHEIDIEIDTNLDSKR